MTKARNKVLVQRGSDMGRATFSWMHHVTGISHSHPIGVIALSIIMYGQELQADCCCNGCRPASTNVSLPVSGLCIVLSSASLFELLHLHHESTALDAVDKDVTALEACIM
jgi:hypothetical protein